MIRLTLSAMSDLHILELIDTGHLCVLTTLATCDLWNPKHSGATCVCESDDVCEHE